MTPAAEAVVRRWDVSRESALALEAYADLLLKWKRRINLVGRVDEEELWRRHIADGLQLLPLLRPTDGVVADLGSGAGVPGLVLAIGAMGRRDLRVHLVESNAKKAAFLSEAARVTGAPAMVHCGRIEDVAREAALSGASLVTARALAPLPELLRLAFPLLSKGARGLFHKGSGVMGELTESAKCWRLNSVTHPSALGQGGCIVEVLEISHA